MILLLAPGPNITFGAMPSGASYVSDSSSLIKVTNNSTADQKALASGGCYTLTPFGGWGSGLIDTLADLYAADAANGLILPGQIGFPLFTAIGVFGDGANCGTWAKTGTGAGAGNWTQVSTSTAVGAALASATALSQAQAASANAMATAAWTAAALAQLATSTPYLHGPTVGAGSAANAQPIFFLDPIAQAGTLDAIEINDLAADTLEVATYRTVAGTLTRQTLQTLALTGAGVSTKPLAPAIQVRLGDIVAIRAQGGSSYPLAGGSYGAGVFVGSGSALPGTVTLGAAAGLIPQVRLHLTQVTSVVTAANFAALQAQVGALSPATIAALFTGTTVTFGRPASAGLSDGSGISAQQIFFLDAISRDGSVTALEVYDKSAGTIDVALYRGSAAPYTLVGTATVTTTGAGKSVALSLSTPLAAKNGDHWLLRCETSGLTSFTGTQADGAGYSIDASAAPPASYTPSAAVTSICVQARLQLSYQDQTVTAASFKALSASITSATSAPTPVPLASADRITLPTGSRVGVLTYGQSNSTGWNAGPPLTTAARPYAALMPASGVKSGKPGNGYGANNTSPGLTGSVALIEDANTGDGAYNPGETPCSGAADALVEFAATGNGLDPSSLPVLASAAGHGGFTIAQLQKGSGWYQSYLDHVAWAANVAAAAGKPYTLPAVLWTQGEADANNAIARASYAAALTQLASDLDNDARATINAVMQAAGLPLQTSPVHLLLSQIATPTGSGTLAGLTNVRLAQMDVVAANPRVHLVGPIAHLGDSGDHIHLVNTGQRLHGLMAGRALKQLLVDARVPDCIWPVSATARGRIITVALRVPKPPLVFDTTALGTVANQSFAVVDGSGNVPIASVAVTASGTAVTIVAGRDLSGVASVRHALDLPTSFNTFANSASGCLRDSTDYAPTIAGAPRPLPYVAPSFALPLIGLAA